MPSREIEHVLRLKEQGASERDIAYAAANIPKDFWDMTRDTVDVAGNEQAFSQVVGFIDDMHNRIGDGRGISIFGPGKLARLITLLGCAVLKSTAINPSNRQRDYKVWRGNYDTIIEDLYHLRGENEYPELKNLLVNYDLLFIDGITHTPPSSPLLSILRTRRDYNKSTILAAPLKSAEVPQRSTELFEIFYDKNIRIEVKPGGEPK